MSEVFKPRKTREEILQEVSCDLGINDALVGEIEGMEEDVLDSSQKNLLKLFLYYTLQWESSSYSFYPENTLSKERILVMKEDEYYGEINFKEEAGVASFPFFYPFEHSEARGGSITRGLGKAIYSAAILEVLQRKGSIKMIQSSASQSDQLSCEAEKVWKRFCELGMAEKDGDCYCFKDLSFLTPKRIEKLREIVARLSHVFSDRVEKVLSQNPSQVIC